MGRIQKSFHLVKMSYRVLMQDKELLILPILSGIFILAATAGFILPMGLLESRALETTDETTLGIVGFLFYVVTYTISFFFQAAVIAGASERMAGGNPTLRTALAAAGRRFFPLLVWGVVAATVGMIIRMIQERSQIVGRIVIGLIGVAWSLATFFVVPVLVMEEKSIFESFKRSGSIFKKTWGETVVGDIGVRLAGFLLILPIIGISALLIAAEQQAVAIVVGVLGLVVLAIFISALHGVFVAAVYRYATSGETPSGFEAEVMQGAFRPKRR